MVSRGVNKVILIGHLGQEPEVRYLSNGITITRISVATSRSWKDKQTHERKEKIDWHRVVLFGKLAEIASEYLHKGSQVYIEGSLQTRKWQNKNGEDRYVTEVIVGIGNTMQMLSSRLREDTKISDQNNLKQYTIEHDNAEVVCEDDSDTNFNNEDIPF